MRHKQQLLVFEQKSREGVWPQSHQKWEVRPLGRRVAAGWGERRGWAQSKESLLQAAAHSLLLVRGRQE